MESWRHRLEGRGETFIRLLFSDKKIIGSEVKKTGIINDPRNIKKNDALFNRNFLCFRTKFSLPISLLCLKMISWAVDLTLANYSMYWKHLTA